MVLINQKTEKERESAEKKHTQKSSRRQQYILIDKKNRMTMEPF